MPQPPRLEIQEFGKILREERDVFPVAGGLKGADIGPFLGEAASLQGDQLGHGMKIFPFVPILRNPDPGGEGIRKAFDDGLRHVQQNVAGREMFSKEGVPVRGVPVPYGRTEPRLVSV